MDDDYLYDAYAGHKTDYISKAAFASQFLTCKPGSCKPSQELRKLTNKSEASTYPLLLYANSARRIRRAFNYDERDVAAALHNLVDPAKPTVLVLLPQMAWGSTSKEFWTTVCRL